MSRSIFEHKYHRNTRLGTRTGDCDFVMRDAPVTYRDTGEHFDGMRRLEVLQDEEIIATWYTRQSNDVIQGDINKLNKRLQTNNVSHDTIIE